MSPKLDPSSLPLEWSEVKRWVPESLFGLICIKRSNFICKAHTMTPQRVHPAFYHHIIIIIIQQVTGFRQSDTPESWVLSVLLSYSFGLCHSRQAECQESSRGCSAAAAWCKQLREKFPLSSSTLAADYGQREMKANGMLNHGNWGCTCLACLARVMQLHQVQQDQSHIRGVKAIKD